MACLARRGAFVLNPLPPGLNRKLFEGWPWFGVSVTLPRHMKGPSKNTHQAGGRPGARRVLPVA